MSIFVPDTETKLYGLLGKTLGHSISPVLHNQAFHDLKLNALYLMLETGEQDLGEYVQSLKNIGFLGWNVTIPHKETIIPYLSGLSSLARDAGAVNTVLNRRGRLTGYNTDVIGFQRQVEETGFIVKDKQAVVLGAGGSARAVIAALIQLDLAKITVVNRTLAHAEEVITIFQEKAPAVEFEFCELEEEKYAAYIKDADLIINTTPVGMYHAQAETKLVINPEYFHDQQLVLDLIYNPLPTELLKAAQAKGAQIGNGLPTLIYQAEASFKLWTKKMPDRSNWLKLGQKAVAEINQQ
ncbi:shikimate dehydrogenase [Halanaerobium salsuginis]|jgi:shikimate dehydrogenase|uniref:Shikimate dehydrogenase (NADP(+)) n=1 Tax=Halanaerobium salsuginis TaxID=29563 RepID=A0A1I4EUF5_9FIRM|nr:shikimate dehydrogenase [Halanaerobium salsuginis]SFL08157.1 shikimate dehydrogenase [Halanaerobium salsuginis]